MQTSMPVFQRFRREGETIGRLVTGYGELELDLLNCIAKGIGDFNKAIKAMFKPRSETKRIAVADKLGREPYTMLGPRDEFDQVIATMGRCAEIRNQYAHRNFYDDDTERLALVNLEELAKKDELIENLSSLTTVHVTAELVEEQERYFLYVRAAIGYLTDEARFRSNTLRCNPFGPEPPLAKPRLAIEIA
jgi:hypothetical protein